MKRLSKNIGIYLIIFGLVLAMAWFYSNGGEKDAQKEVSYSVMCGYAADKRISEINITETKITATLKNGDKVYAFAASIVDLQWFSQKYVFPQIESDSLKYKTDEPKRDSILWSLLPTLIMIAALVFFFFMIMNQGGGGGKAMSFGKSRARLHKDSDLRKVTFKDVAGLDEEKEELAEVVDFLKNPKKYNSLGARIPKGMLLVGPPGTGKTYISKATAGEAGVPFFTISGSDFVEMFVGVGASRVRDLFEQAKKNSPCIIFIDEIDAVGRKRGAGLGGGHDEREQTLNQLLVEMDGFGENAGIIILAATNRPDILDPALLRPGRFDRQIVIGAPDIKGREAIFRVHSKNKPLAKEVDPKVLARRTPGFTPADIENMLNEAALLTARRNGLKIRMDEIEDAITKVIAGPEKKSRVISEEERKLTAFHEAGHAIVAHSLPKTDPVHQITIVPRGRAGGFTMILPKEDKYYGTKTTMREQIVHLLGGRVAELLTLDDISTGASNDILRATEIAKDMITKYGFSDRLGPVNYSSSDEVFLGRDFSTRQNYSEETASEIDGEVKSIVEACFEEAKAILSENLDKLNTVAEALLEIETLDGEQFEQLYNGEMTAKELAAEVMEQEDLRQEKNKAEAREAARLQEEAEELEEEIADLDHDAWIKYVCEHPEKFLPEARKAAGLPEETAEEDDFDREADQTIKKTAETRGRTDEDGAGEEEPEAQADDDMPSEEELAKYDGDYFADEEPEEAENDKRKK